MVTNYTLTVASNLSVGTADRYRSGRPTVTVRSRFRQFGVLKSRSSHRSTACRRRVCWQAVDTLPLRSRRRRSIRGISGFGGGENWL